ncbi:MAG: cytochrome P450 [Spirochaetaceae bacterium]|nr:cytochrome P450 [Spirochaetaceae bacterium]
MRVEDQSLMDPEVQESPFAYYRALLEQAPVYLMPEIGAYVVSRYRDVQHVLAHPEIWSNDLLGKAGFSMFQHREAQEVLEAGGWPRDTKLQTDPPIHRDYRGLVAPAFTAGRVRALEPFVRETAEALARDLAREGECEFIATFAAWLPIRVITRLLGLPAEDAGRIKHWSDAWVEPLSGVISKEREIEVAHLGVELQQYLAAWMEEKRESPAEDVLSELAVACFPDGRPLPMAEKMGIAEHLIVGGHETATSALASGVMLLAQQPEVARALREDPGLVRNFVEEVLRLESPSQGFFRFALETAEVAGVQIPKGSMVQVRFAAANRDPAQFPDPDRLDLHRPNAGAHMAFSQGEHHCVGAPLARLELQTAFRVLLDRFERIEIPEGSVLTHLPGLALRTLSALPIRVA